MGASVSGAGQDADEEARRRLNAYTYLSAPERLEHVAIMRVFCGTLLADLAVPDIMAKLRQTGASAAGLDADTLTVRLEQLVQWGNLLRSSHTVNASSISEYQRSRSRYQLSKLGERIQRDADGVLAEADAAREVSNELLALVERGLRELADLVTAPGGVEPQDGLERIGTLFVQFTEFADSIRDFYAYLGQVLSRYDLDSAEYQGFKELLLDYVEAITEDVAFRAPRISAALDTLWPHIPALLDRLDSHAQGLTGLSAQAQAQGESRLEVRIQRSRGRELADWEGLRGWFSNTDGQGSQVDQLRDATLRALQSLLANAKRMLRSATGEMSRRKDLLRLARWFDEAAPQDAHDIAVAAFGLYGARHLGIPPATDEVVPAYTSWWTGPVVEVPVALRERGSRAQRGRASAVEDHSAQKQLLKEAARQRAAARAAAADELRSASGRFAEVRLTSAALSLLLELLATALGNAQLSRHVSTNGERTAGFDLDSASSEDAELRIRLTVRRTAGTRTVLYSADGDLLLDDLELDIGRTSAAVDGEAEASVS
ncbi:MULTISPECIES: TIGR02677 family protein [Streptomyces]|uniref:TIGR02677 family protein n=2 Tax=Streptomyces griseoaurantiacus TaxID=68213 RepID=A0A1G7RC22_9ACTN|nr:MULTISPECIES: TIGR02677 family protein [Streptomyces]MBA5221616.1 TIGR02677 family protein [Streptomyces griseoaurantiacus]MDX3087702.1 TIGR02677 family protein [Streptomyces sp. ME12-02E]MDX3331118.1 TIGR02677 family protein [Streptomyces sp. ME02-6978a]WTI28086.1 TIGR02677 family protein [Streptomyces jietaisiensis]SDG08283.1 TIGR02677 family protein [Streptomyces jietaisiensis]